MYKIREIKTVYGKSKSIAENISTPQSVVKFFSFLKKETKEYFYVLSLNNKNIPVHYEQISVGTISESIVHPREVFCCAIREKASSIICVHNHPSGNSNPSSEDIETTKRIKECGDLLGITLLDHVIIADNSFLSMRKSGHM